MVCMYRMYINTVLEWTITFLLISLAYLLSAYNVSNGHYTVIANLPNSIFQFRKFNNNFNNNNDFNKYNDH